jgi:hypothetical protein
VLPTPAPSASGTSVLAKRVIRNLQPKALIAPLVNDRSLEMICRPTFQAAAQEHNYVG